MVPTQHPDKALTTVAYFSMEFMLSEACHLFRRTCNVAGDQMKAPATWVFRFRVGLLYGQVISEGLRFASRQQALYPVNDPGQLPIRLCGSEWRVLRLQIQLPGSKIWLRCWRCQWKRKVVSSRHQRLCQYRLIAESPVSFMRRRRDAPEAGDCPRIGGWRLLRALDLAPEVCHSTKARGIPVLERARHYMEITRSHSILP